MRMTFILLMLTAAVCSVSAQSTPQKEKFLRISPLPVVYYSPETRLGFGALLAGNLNLGRDSLTTGSYLQSSFIYTLNKQYEWSNTGRLYTSLNTRIIEYRLYYAYFPEYFFGYQTQTPEQFKTLIKFNRLWLELKHLWRIRPFVYAGLYGRYNRIYKLTSDLGSSLETLQPPGASGYSVGGIAPSVQIDSRDSQVYPKKGVFVDFAWMVYTTGISDFSFSNIKIDARYYRSPRWLNDDVIATQVVLNINSGTVPFRDMADIGGSNTMRGYYRGYLRYQNLYAIQTEYRFMFSKLFGLAAWVGAALTSEDWYRPLTHSVKPNAGIGLRLRINQKDKLNLRADYGFGRNQTGLYLDASEAY